MGICLSNLRSRNHAGSQGLVGKTARGSVLTAAAARIFLVAALLAVVLSACSESGREGSGSATPANGLVAVTTFEWGYTPNAITVTRGEEVRIDLSNQGTMVHNLQIDDLEATAIESQNGELFVEADEGEQGSLSFIPSEAGEFEFYCTISGHRRQGMEGTLVVR